MKRLLIFISLMMGFFSSSVWADYDVTCKEALPAGLQFTRNCQAINSWINFYNVVPAVAPDGLVNAVVKMPAGTNVEWQVNMNTGVLAVVPVPATTPTVSKHGQKKSVTPVVINYLGVMGNYGIVPRTVIGNANPAPLEIIVIGGPLLRGSITQVKLIGAIELFDNIVGEYTYKLIAILPSATWAATVNTLSDLDPGVTTGIKSIIQTWFENYSGNYNGASALSFTSFLEAGNPGDSFTSGTAFGILDDSNTQ